MRRFTIALSPLSFGRLATFSFFNHLQVAVNLLCQCTVLAFTILLAFGFQRRLNALLQQTRLQGFDGYETLVARETTLRSFLLFFIATSDALHETLAKGFEVGARANRDEVFFLRIDNFIYKLQTFVDAFAFFQVAQESHVVILILLVQLPHGDLRVAIDELGVSQQHLLLVLE